MSHNASFFGTDNTLDEYNHWSYPVPNKVPPVSSIHPEGQGTSVDLKHCLLKKILFLSSSRGIILQLLFRESAKTWIHEDGPSFINFSPPISTPMKRGCCCFVTATTGIYSKSENCVQLIYGVVLYSVCEICVDPCKRPVATITSHYHQQTHILSYCMLHTICINILSSQYPPLALASSRSPVAIHLHCNSRNPTCQALCFGSLKTMMGYGVLMA